MRPRHGRRGAAALLLGALAGASLVLLAQSQPDARRVEVSSDLAVVLSAGEISVEARPLEGEGPEEFARRLGRDEATVKGVLAAGASEERRVVLGYGSLSDEARLASIRALFPSDVRARDGWLHVAVGDEALAAVAAWFAGSAARAPEIARANGIEATRVSRGTLVRIPSELLVPPFRDEGAVDGDGAPTLEFGEDEKGRVAVYRLRKGEALYSAVVVRFTGRLHAEDVIELALKIAIRSGIDDVHAIPVGFPVKIPVDYLAEEFLPADDPKAQAFAKERAEAAQFSRPAAVRWLSGVRVVIDAGHGGRDTGTLHHGVWEATYVYDVAVRLRKLLVERTQAEVVMTTSEPGVGFDVPDRDRLANRSGRVVLTDPPYRLDDPTVGVNLRWYLANSVLRRPGGDKKPIPPERTVFLSIHADSLHPSVRGAMVYVPGERFLRDRFGRRGAVYAPYREWREEPVVSFKKKDRVVAEGASTRLAERLLLAMREAELPVHRFSPVRTHVIRGGREWVPAVLRYNRIPNRVLVEISNLGNEEDRALTLTRTFRQSMAEALLAGLLDFFGTARERLPSAALASQRSSGPGEVPPAAVPAPSPASPAKGAALPAAPPPVGPWPAPYGPWPEVRGPWPRPAGPAPQAAGGPGRPPRTPPATPRSAPP